MFRTLALLLSGLALIGGQAWAAGIQEGSWTLEPGGQPEACGMKGPVSGDARLFLATDGPLLLLLVSAPSLPADKNNVVLDVRLNAGPVHHMPVLAVSHTAGISLGVGTAHDIAAASQVSISYQGATWSFAISRTGPAIDAMTKCAGEPTLAERDASAPKPIAGAGKWTLIDGLPGAAGACSGRLEGREVDTMLMPGQDGVFVLIAGRADWASWGREGEAELAIDGGPPERLKAQSLSNLVLVRIDEPFRGQRLRKAAALDWALPNGRFHAEVSGLGTALDAVSACQARRAKAKG